MSQTAEQIIPSWYMGEPLPYQPYILSSGDLPESRIKGWYIIANRIAGKRIYDVPGEEEITVYHDNNHLEVLNKFEEALLAGKYQPGTADSNVLAPFSSFVTDMLVESGYANEKTRFLTTFPVDITAKTRVRDSFGLYVSRLANGEEGSIYDAAYIANYGTMLLMEADSAPSVVQKLERLQAAYKALDMASRITQHYPASGLSNKDHSTVLLRAIEASLNLALLEQESSPDLTPGQKHQNFTTIYRAFTAFELYLLETGEENPHIEALKNLAEQHVKAHVYY